MLHRSETPSSDDPRTITVSRMQRRYGVDPDQARRVNVLAQALWARIEPAGAEAPDALLSWAAAVHEIGMAIAHENYHRHSAYVMEHSDIYGFSEQERAALALLVLGHTGTLKKLDRDALPHKLLARLVCLRLAALFCHGRVDETPQASLAAKGDAFALAVDAHWLAERPLTAFLLDEEATRWLKYGVPFSLKVA